MARCRGCFAKLDADTSGSGLSQWCSDECRAADESAFEALTESEKIIIEKTNEVFNRDCPECGGKGPVDFHEYYKIWSLLVVTRYSDHEIFCCSRCAAKTKIGAILFCGVFGWWGIPYGIIGTPVQLVKNLLSLLSSNPNEPSPEIRDMVRQDFLQAQASQKIKPVVTSLDGDIENHSAR